MEMDTDQLQSAIRIVRDRIELVEEIVWEYENELVQLYDQERELLKQLEEGD